MMKYSTDKREEAMSMGKKRITIRLDDIVIDWFREQAALHKKGSYQRLINETLRGYIQQEEQSLESILRRVIREESDKYELVIDRHLVEKQLIEAQIYENEEAFLADAIQNLWQNRADLRVKLAVYQYEQGQISLAQAAILAGITEDNMVEEISRHHLKHGGAASSLLRFSGAIPAEDLQLMSQAIADDCGSVDFAEW